MQVLERAVGGTDGAAEPGCATSPERPRHARRRLGRVGGAREVRGPVAGTERTTPADGVDRPSKGSRATGVRMARDRACQRGSDPGVTSPSIYRPKGTSA